MKLSLKRCLRLGCFMWASVGAVAVSAAPPFEGTAWVSPHVITSMNPTTFLNVTTGPKAERKIFDRRSGAWETLSVYVFEARFSDRKRPIEFRVHPEFGSFAVARERAQFYADVLGRVPSCLKRDIDFFVINKGFKDAGGGNSSIIMHDDYGVDTFRKGFLEEILVHEAAHTSLEASLMSSSVWINAQTKDPEFISTYARDNPAREDVAESFLLYLAQKYRSESLSEEDLAKIREAMPQRINVFDSGPSCPLL